MLNATETLAAAIEQLGRLSHDRPASFDDLVALNAARETIDELFRDCVDELSTDPQTASLWSAVSSANRLVLKPRSRPGTDGSYGSPAADARADKRVRSFWDDFEPRFTWDFLPVDFLHALYVQWLSTESPKDVPFPRGAFARRLKAAAITSGDWFYTRSRAGSLMNAAEPLLTQAPGWIRDDSERALYGFRRSGR